MTRAGLFGAAAACLLLGVADLGALNLWLAPQVWPPGPGSGGAPEVIAPSRPIPPSVDARAPAEVDPVAPADTPTPEEAEVGGAGTADAVDEPVVDDPPAEEPVVDEPVVEDPPAEEPVIEEPVIEEPVIEEPPTAADAVLREPLVLNFDPGSAEMRAGGRRRLSRLAKELKGRAGLRLVVEGHTDDTGTEQVNERLGAQRARTVARYLERRLGDQVRIDHRGFGSVRPLDPGSGPAARARNRRVEVKLGMGEP